MAFIKEIREAAIAINKDLAYEVAIPGSDPNMSDAGNIRIPSTSFVLNLLLGGGVPLGRIIEVYGDESVGKCLTEDTYLSINGVGSLMLGEIIDQCGIREELLSSNGEPVQTGLPGLPFVSFNGERDVVEVSATSGNIIRSSLWHEHLTIDRDCKLIYKRANEFGQGDYLVYRVGGEFGNVSISADEGYLLGVLLADGYLGESRIAVTNDDPDIISFLREVASKLIGVVPREYPKNQGSIDFHFNNIDAVTSFLDAHGLGVWRAGEKRLGSHIRSLTKSSLRHVIAGYFDCKSFAGNKNMEVTSASYQLLFEIKLMLAQFSVYAALNKKRVWNYPENTYFRLTIGHEDSVNFIEQFGTRSTKVNKRYRTISERKLQPSQIIPFAESLVSAIYQCTETNCLHHKLTSDIRNSRTRATRYRIGKMLSEADWCECPELDMLTELFSKYRFDEIAKVNFLGSAPVFDVQSGSVDRNVTANGLVSHNSTIAQHMMVGFQQSGGLSVLLDAETGWHRGRAVAMGHDSDRHLHLQADTVELGAKALLKTIDRLTMPGKFPKKMPIGIFWDTISSSQTEGEKEGDMYKDGIADKPRKIRQMLRVVSPKLPQANASLVFISQTITNIKGQGGPRKIAASGGNALRFWSSIRLKVWRGKTINYPVDHSGMLVTVNSKKNKMAPPNYSVELPLMYDIGVHPGYELIVYLLDNSTYVNMDGGRVHVPDFPEPGEEISFYMKGLPSILDKYPDLIDYLANCAKASWPPEQD